MLVHILCAKVVILCVEPYLELKNNTFFFRGWGGTLSPNQWAYSNPFGDRGTPSIVTGSTYDLSAEMWKDVVSLARSS